MKKRLWHRCFPMNFAKFLRTLFLAEHLRWLLLHNTLKAEIVWLRCAHVLLGRKTKLINHFLYKKYFNSMTIMLKVVSIAFLLVCFVCLKDSTCETRINAFYFISKALLVLEIIKFNVLDIQISWRHQMPKHETRNTYYWITWEVSAIW